MKKKGFIYLVREVVGGEASGETKDDSGRWLRSGEKRCDEREAERQRRNINYGASGRVCTTEGEEHESWEEGKKNWPSDIN